MIPQKIKHKRKKNVTHTFSTATIFPSFSSIKKTHRTNSNDEKVPTIMENKTVENTKRGYEAGLCIKYNNF